MRLAVTALLGALLFALAPTWATAQDAGPGPVRLSGLFYLAYEDGTAGGADYSGFVVNRSYLTARTAIMPGLSARITLDSDQDDTGDVKVRLKYVYASVDLGTAGPLHDVDIEAGLVHTPWLDFEQHVNLYRMRGRMFAERVGLFNSADFGITAAGLLGGEVGESYQDEVSSSYPGRWGSFAVGVYNGGGYHATEMNENRSVQGRLTIRPLPDGLPGLQLSGVAIVGKGNQPDDGADPADWHTYNLFASYQHRLGTLTAQYLDGRGNQKGTFVEPGDPTEATEYSGYSLFGEGKLGPWRVLGGYDDFDRKPGSADLSFTGYHFGIGYALGHGNVLLLDMERRDWDAGGLPTDSRGQVVLQVAF